MLGEIAIPSAWLLAGVFLFAAFTKLRSPASTLSSVREFGFSRLFGATRLHLISRLLAPAEFITAAMLLFKPPVGAAVSVVLLTFFTAVVLRAVTRGQLVRCGCFGGTDARPVGYDSVLRNVGLIALSVTVLAGPSHIQLPSLAASGAVVGASVCLALCIALVRLRTDVGAVFSQRLPTQAARATQPPPSSPTGRAAEVLA